MLVCSGLGKRFPTGRSLVFPDFSLQEAGELLILGPSGCGKTTLLHILAGLLRPDQGEILFQGLDFLKLKPSEMDRFRGQHIGICLQKPVFIRALSVLDNLLLSQHLAKGTSDRNYAMSLLGELGLSHAADRLTDTLSMGERQRLMFIRALINRPALILADEPTSALDDRNAGLLMEMLVSHSREHRAALVVVTHDQRVRPFFNQSVLLS